MIAACRAFIARNRLWLGLSVPCAALAWAFYAWLGQYYSFSLNMTDSMPGSFYWVDKTQKHVEVGGLLAFKIGANAYYEEGSTFLKIVGGVSGDQVKEIDGVYYVNEHAIGAVKPFSKKGLPLTKGPVGIIPEGHYFVYTPHPDSYDSRYADIGWISPIQVVGVAYEIL